MLHSEAKIEVSSADASCDKLDAGGRLSMQLRRSVLNSLYDSSALQTLARMLWLVLYSASVVEMSKAPLRRYEE